MTRAIALALLILALHPASTARAVPAEVRKVPPGVKLIVSRQPQIPIVSIVVLFRGGTLLEPASKAGVAALAAELLQRGTAAHPGDKFATALDAIGAELSVDTSTDMVTVSLSSLTANLDAALDLLQEVLVSAAFAPADFAKARAETIASLKASEEDPGFVASRAFLRTLYGTHAYGRVVQGSEATLKTLTREDCVAYWRRISVPKSAAITAAGDVTAADLDARVRRRLGKWLARAQPAPPLDLKLPPQPPGSPLVRIDRPLTQTTILAGARGISRLDPDYYALEVFNYVLGGGGFSSRLIDEIRDNRGLAYGVSSAFDARLLPGPFQIHLETKNRTAKQALDLVRKEVADALASGITPKELEDAKAYLTGSYPRRYDTNAEMARFLAATEFYGLGTDYDRVYPAKIRAVTGQDVLRAARAHVDPPRFVVVAVGKLAETGLGPP